MFLLVLLLSRSLALDWCDNALEWESDESGECLRHIIEQIHSISQSVSELKETVTAGCKTPTVPDAIASCLLGTCEQPNTLKLVVHQAKCRHVLGPRSEPNELVNISRKIDLSEYNGTDDTQYFHSLYARLLQYANDTLHTLGAFAIRDHREAEYETSRYSRGIASVMPSLFLYYRDDADHDVVQVGSESELKLLYARGMNEVVMISACVGWQQLTKVFH